MEKIKKNKPLKRGKWFCIIIMSIYITQWLIFFCYSRLNSVLTSFQEYVGVNDMGQGIYKLLPFDRFFDNYKRFFVEMKETPGFLENIFNGYKFWILSYIVNSFSIIIAFYIYKKYPFAGGMMLVLMVPGILSGVTQPLLFKYFVNYVIPEVAGNPRLVLFADKNGGALGAALFMSTFFAFPGGMLFYVSQFSKIPQEQIEAARLDGCTFIKEFWYLGFPSVFRLWSLGNLAILTAGLTTAGPGYTLYGDQVGLYGLQTLQTDIFVRVKAYPLTTAPYSAAINLMLAIVTMAGIAIMKRVWEKVDPNND